MAEMSNEGATSAGAGIDLSQFYQVFFEEAGENLRTWSRCCSSST
jgi:two-component system chemotaxis sensor kinase CheA